MTGSNREELAEQRAKRLIALVEPQLPLDTYVTGAADAWQLDGPALLSRQTMDDDARKVGVELLDDVHRREFERQLSSLPKEMPDLLQRAAAADKHWVGRIPALEESSKTATYRGLYAIAYRRHSAVAHPSLMGLNFVTVDLPDGGKRVQLEERDPDMHGPFGLGPVLVAFSLYIASQTIGWPAADEVTAAFE